MKRIPLPKNRFALVDDEDYERLKDYSWCVDTKGYAYRNIPRVEGKSQKRVKMHRQVLGLTESFPLADHRDCNRLNNQKYNLRIGNHHQNSANRLKSSLNTSGFKGVCWNRQSQKWQAGIKYEGRSMHLGLFATPEEAHKAYCTAAAELFGEFANGGEK